MDFEVSITADTELEGYEEACEGEFVKIYVVDKDIDIIIESIHSDLNTTESEMYNTNIDEFFACYDLYVEGITYNIEIS